MFENFPYTDMHQLNLDWIVKIAKDFLEQYTSIQQMISDGQTSLTNLTTEGLEQLQNKADQLETLLDQWYTTHSSDIANQLAAALADIQTTLNTAVADFGTAADAKAAQAIASIPADYTTLFNQVQKVDIISNNAEGVANKIVDVGTVFTPVENEYSVLRRDGTIVSAQYANRKVTDPIPVTVGDIYIYDLPAYDLTNAASYVFYDSNGNYLTGRNFYDDGYGSQNPARGVLSTPVGAATLRFGYATPYLQPTFKKAITISAIVNQIENDIISVQNTKLYNNDALNNIINVGNQISTSITQSKIMRRNGAIEDGGFTTRYVTDPISVTPGKIYHIDMVALYLNNYLNYAFFNDQNEIIESYNYYDRGGMTEAVPISYIVIAPANAAYMRISGSTLSENPTPVIKEMIPLTTYTRKQIVYVSPSGNDNNDGSSSTKAFRTLQKAVDSDAVNIVLLPGTYESQTTLISGKHNMNIACLSSGTETDYISKFQRKKRAIFDNSIAVTGLAAYGSIYRAALTLPETSSYHKVFISQELPVIYTNSDYFGNIETYNAILWEQPEDISKCKQLTPVLTQAECNNTPGSFFWDGSYIYVHPVSEDITNVLFKRLAIDDSTTPIMGLRIINSTNIKISGINMFFFPFWAIRAQTNENIEFNDCEILFTNYRTAISIEGTDAIFNNCVVAYAGGDGWGCGQGGNVSLYGCSALYCADDGVSHHINNTGIIDSGVFSYNKKGGITPAFGALINIQNVYCEGNGRGIMYTATGASQVRGAVCYIRNCTMRNNIDYDIEVRGYHVISSSCQYATKYTMMQGVIDEYGNTILE